jgi:hypothetical protein
MEADWKSGDEIEADLRKFGRAIDVRLLADAWHRIDELSLRVRRLEERLAAAGEAAYSLIWKEFQSLSQE